jgi:hypothetical protein
MSVSVAAGCSFRTFHPSLEVGEGSLASEGLDVDTVTLNLRFLLEAVEITHDVRSESILTGDEDGLATWELELGSSEGLAGVSDELWLGADRNEDGSDVDTGALAQCLSVSVSHTSLESISTGAGKHLVDADNVPWVHTDADVETFSSGVDLHILVGSNTASLKSLRGDLFLLLGNKMDTAWENVPVGLLPSTVVHTELRIWHTTVEA